MPLPARRCLWRAALLFMPWRRVRDGQAAADDHDAISRVAAASSSGAWHTRSRTQHVQHLTAAQDAVHAGHVQDLIMSREVAVMSSTLSHACHRCAGWIPAIVGLHADRAMHAGMQSGSRAVLCSRRHEACSAWRRSVVRGGGRQYGVQVADEHARDYRCLPPRTSSGDTAQALDRASACHDTVIRRA